MWKYLQKTIEPIRIFNYQILEKDTTLTFGNVIELWQTNKDFQKFYTKIITDSPFPALFWEHPPMMKSSLNNDYEFVLIKSKSLTTVSPEAHVFDEHFQASEAVVSFPNLRGDAQLIVPKPLTGNENYAHLAAFLRTAPEEQSNLFWQKIAAAVLSKIGHEKKWLSTAGLGVYWCHVRVDSRPKYYKFSKYRN